MSTRRSGEGVIKYLTFDEMMLKVAQMRAERANGQAAPPAAPKPAAEPAPVLWFPDYVSHCEAWCAGEEREEVRRIIEASTVRRAPAVRPVPAPAIRAGRERYAFSIATLVIAAVILIGTAVHFGPSKPTMMMIASSAGHSLVAGRDAWKEIDDDDLLLEAPAQPEAPRRVRPRMQPDQIEREVREMLASNGFPDIGVSASHRGEVYLAGEVFSLDEADNIVKVARLAAPGTRVYFLHPELRNAEGSAFFGAIAGYAPDVWGAKIRTVVIGSPAYKAGIRDGDVIREFDHMTVADARDLEKAVAQHKPGQRVSIRIWRSGSNNYRIARLVGLTQFALR